MVTEAVAMSLSMARAGEWGNLLTAHARSSFCGIWSTDSKAIVKKPLELSTQASKDRVLTSVLASRCGNAGFLGYDNGLVLRINVQSGKERDSFKVEGRVSGMALDWHGRVLWIGTQASLTAITIASH